MMLWPTAEILEAYSQIERSAASADNAWSDRGGAPRRRLRRACSHRDRGGSREPQAIIPPLTHLRICANVWRELKHMQTTQQRRARLSIDVPREARRRIHIAAAKRDQSIRDYVWEAVEARLKHDLADELSAADLVALNERADPVLADLWNNPKDAAYDKL